MVRLLTYVCIVIVASLLNACDSTGLSSDEDLIKIEDSSLKDVGKTALEIFAEYRLEIEVIDPTIHNLKKINADLRANLGVANLSPRKAGKLENAFLSTINPYTGEAVFVSKKEKEWRAYYGDEFNLTSNIMPTGLEGSGKVYSFNKEKVFTILDKFEGDRKITFYTEESKAVDTHLNKDNETAALFVGDEIICVASNSTPHGTGLLEMVTDKSITFMKFDSVIFYSSLYVNQSLNYAVVGSQNASISFIDLKDGGIAQTGLLGQFTIVGKPDNELIVSSYGSNSSIYSIRDKEIVQQIPANFFAGKAQKADTTYFVFVNSTVDTKTMHLVPLQDIQTGWIGKDAIVRQLNSSSEFPFFVSDNRFIVN